jgi:hypothetical protein
MQTVIKVMDRRDTTTSGRMHTSLAHLVVVVEGTAGVGAGACKWEDEARLIAEGEVTTGVEDEATVGGEVDARRSGTAGITSGRGAFGKRFQPACRKPSSRGGEKGASPEAILPM